MIEILSIHPMTTANKLDSTFQNLMSMKAVTYKVEYILQNMMIFMNFVN
jgi:hypothetical protein